MLLGSSQMTAQLLLSGTEPERVDRISELLIDAALGRLAPATPHPETRPNAGEPRPSAGRSPTA